jgi:hypothetical protein
MVQYGAQEVTTLPFEKQLSTDKIRTWYFNSWHVKCNSRPINAYPEDIHCVEAQSTNRFSVKRGLHDTGHYAL